ncbi:MAG: MFS transporter [Patescibacteria group bacterium]
MNLATSQQFGDINFGRYNVFITFKKNTSMTEPTLDKQTNKRIFGLPKNIFFLGLTSFFNDFSSEMVFSVFPAFFTSVLKAGAGALGLVDGIAEGLSNLFKIYSGALSDKFQNRKQLIVIGYTLSVLTRPFYVLTSVVSGALGLRVLDRVGKGLRDAPRDAIISLSSPKEELGRSFGYHRTMDTLGAILGPLVAYFILKNYPLRFSAVFTTAFFVGIIAIGTLFFISDIALRTSSRPVSITDVFKKIPPKFKIFLFSIFVLSLGSIPIAILLLKTQSIGLMIADIPLFYMVYNLSYAGFSITAGRVSDKVGAKAVIFVGYAILLVSYLFLYEANTAWVLVASFFILGLFPALTDGVQRSLAAQLTTEELRGGALGLLNAAVGIGALFAGVGGGYLWQVYGSGFAFFAAGVAIVIGLFLFFYSTRTENAVTN